MPKTILPDLVDASPAHRSRGDGVGRAEVDVRGRIAHPPLEVARDAGNDVEVRSEAVAVARAGAAGGGEEFRSRGFEHAQRAFGARRFLVLERSGRDDQLDRRFPSFQHPRGHAQVLKLRAGAGADVGDIDARS